MISSLTVAVGGTSKFGTELWFRILFLDSDSLRGGISCQLLDSFYFLKMSSFSLAFISFTVSLFHF